MMPAARDVLDILDEIVVFKQVSGEGLVRSLDRYEAARTLIMMLMRSVNDALDAGAVAAPYHAALRAALEKVLRCEMNAEHVKVLEQMRASGFDFDFGNEQYAAIDAAIAALGGNASEVLIAVKRPEGYEDVHPDLVAEDFANNPGAFTYRVIAAPQPEPRHD